MPLPTEKSQPTLNPLASKILLYGEKGIGKTTLAANFIPDKTLLLATEPGHGRLSIFVETIDSWDRFREAGALLAEGGHGFEAVAIDTIDQLHRLCQDKVMKDLGLTHPSEAEYGKAWSALADEWALRIAKLCSLGLAVIFVSHEKVEEIKTRTGPINKAVPTLKGAPGNFVEGFVDYILRADQVPTEDGELRVLRTQPSENWKAKQRVIEGHPRLADLIVFEADPTSAGADALRAELERTAKPTKKPAKAAEPVAA